MTPIYALPVVVRRLVYIQNIAPCAYLRLHIPSAVKTGLFNQQDLISARRLQYVTLGYRSNVRVPGRWLSS